LKREINYNLEALRAMACVMVICIHVSNYYCRGYGLGEVSNTSYIISVVWNSISRIAVPIFFMISGALLLEERIQLRKSFKRVGRTMLTLLLWSGIYYVWNMIYRDRLYDVEMLLEEPVKKHLWFLYAIIGIYLILPFLQCMVCYMSDEMAACFVAMWYGLLTIEYIVSFMKVDIAYSVPLIGNSCYVGYFILGYILKTRLGNIPVSIRTFFLGATLALLAIIILTCICTSLERTHVDKLFENRNVLVAISASLVFCGMQKRQGYSDRVKRILRFVSKHSFMIYLCHVIFIDIVKLEFAPRSVPAFFGIPFYTGLVFVTSVLFSMAWCFIKNTFLTEAKFIK